MDLVTEAMQAVSYSTFVLEPDGSKVPQSSSLSTIERLLRLADLHPGQRVLEIGTGSGYTGAVLSHMVGPGGGVASIDVDAELVKRAIERHKESTNIAIIAGDGFAGVPEHGPYARILGWTTPLVLPAAWVEQADYEGIIVTPVKVASVATANMVARVGVRSGQPVDISLHDGSFVDCSPKASYDFALPAHHVDASQNLPGGVAWLSSPVLRGQDNAAGLLEELTGNPTVADADRDVVGDMNAMIRHLFAEAGDHLAAAEVGDGRGFGVATGDSIAIVLEGKYHLAGTGNALTLLNSFVSDWKRMGQPEHNRLAGQATKTDGGWTIRAVLPNRTVP